MLVATDHSIKFTSREEYGRKQGKTNGAKAQVTNDETPR
jgi:hypothetical protein